MEQDLQRRRSTRSTTDASKETTSTSTTTTTEADIVFRPAEGSDADGITECWYEAFRPYPLNDWILPSSSSTPRQEHARYLAHFSRTMRATIARGDSGIHVAHDRRGDRIAGYVTYKETVDRVIQSRPSFVGRLRFFLHLIVDRVISTYDRLVYGDNFDRIDRRFSLIARQQAAIFREHADVGFPAGPGRRYLYITWLAVHPAYQGKRVSSLLLRHGQETGLPLYLESSHEGRPVYLHKGFRELGPRLEIRREDGSLVESLPTMLYDPDRLPRQ